MGFSNDQFEDMNSLLKTINSFVEQIKGFYSIKKAIIKQQLLINKNKKNDQNILMNETFKLVGQRSTLIDFVQQLLQKMKKFELEVLTLSKLENQYLSDSFSSFDNTFKASQQEPQILLQTIKLVQQRDQKLNELHQPSGQLNCIIEKINQNIDCRFQECIGQEQDSISILKNSNFIIKDMEKVQKYIQKCFPNEIKIFNVFESQYRQNLEIKIQKDIDESIVKEKFEVLTNLIEWICFYEQQIINAGGQPFEFSQLKSKLMMYMPIFQDHIRSVTIQYFQSSIEEDTKQLTIEQLDEFIQNNQQISLNFPNDCFHYLNQQIDTMCAKLEVNQFIEWIRQIGNIFSKIIIDEERQVILNIVQQIENNIDRVYNKGYAYEQLQDPNIKEIEEKQIQRDCNLAITRIVVMINAFHKCEKFSIETMKHSLSYYQNRCEEYYQERITKIFREDIYTRFKQFIDFLLQQILKIICDQINIQIMPNLFKLQYVEDTDKSIDLTFSTQTESNVIQLIEKVDFYLKFMKKKLQLCNIYYIQISKLLIQSTVNLYWNQIDEEIKQEYKDQEDILSFISQISLCIIKEFSPTNRKEKKEIKVTSIFSSHNNFEMLAIRVENDMEIFSKYFSNSSNLQLSQNSQQNLLNQFNTFIKCIQIQNSQISQIMQSIYFNFPKDISFQIFSTILRMRQGITQNQKKELIQKFQQYSQNNKTLEQNNQ